MVKCSRSIELDATPEEVWAVISRYMRTNEYSPLVVSVEALTTGEDGIGSKRRNFFENGSSITEEAIEWIPNRSQRIVGSEFGPIPLRNLIAQIDITANDADKTTLNWSLDFTVKYGPVGWLMGQVLMKRAFGNVVAGNLEAVAECIVQNRASAESPPN